MIELLRANQRLKVSRVKRQIITAAITSLVYTVWQQRNKKIWKGEDVNEAEVIRRIKTDVRFRANMFCSNKKIVKDREWIGDL